MVPNLWPDELKILTIDDEWDILNLIRLSLEPAGFRVLRADSPEEGLKVAIKEEPDLMILDIMMPEVDGFELLRRIRRHPRIGQAPVIILSARAKSVMHQRMLTFLESKEFVIDAYVGKPFQPSRLLQTVKDVLVKHRDFLVEKNKRIEKPRAVSQTYRRTG